MCVFKARKKERHGKGHHTHSASSGEGHLSLQPRTLTPLVNAVSLYYIRVIIQTALPANGMPQVSRNAGGDAKNEESEDQPRIHTAPPAPLVANIFGDGGEGFLVPPAPELVPAGFSPLEETETLDIDEIMI